MKKILSVFVACAMTAAVLTGCGAKEAVEETTVEETTVEETTVEETETVAVLETEASAETESAEEQPVSYIDSLSAMYSFVKETMDGHMIGDLMKDEFGTTSKMVGEHTLAMSSEECFFDGIKSLSGVATVDSMGTIIENYIYADNGNECVDISGMTADGTINPLIILPMFREGDIAETLDLNDYIPGAELKVNFTAPENDGDPILMEFVDAEGTIKITEKLTYTETEDGTYSFHVVACGQDGKEDMVYDYSCTADGNESTSITNGNGDVFSYSSTLSNNFTVLNSIIPVEVELSETAAETTEE